MFHRYKDRDLGSQGITVNLGHDPTDPRNGNHLNVPCIDVRTDHPLYDNTSQESGP